MTEEQIRAIVRDEIKAHNAGFATEITFLEDGGIRYDAPEGSWTLRPAPRAPLGEAVTLVEWHG